MNVPDSQQRCLAGEYYVASIISRLGYDIGITLGRAKIVDMVAIGKSGKSVNIQVKCTHHGYDWLVSRKSDGGENSILALVRLGKDCLKRPERYCLRGPLAKELTSDIYESHSPRIGRAKVQKVAKDHDFKLIEEQLD